MKSLTQKQQLFIFWGVILLLLIFYGVQLTRYGLWLDEGVEYLYSKYLSGPIPYELCSKAANMYERIISTYQPPLYNFLMYFWLLIFDSEFMFRLFSLLAVILGGMGIYKSLRYVSSDFNCALFGMTAYLLLPCVGYYGAECAEYSLLLCFVPWAIYYYIRAYDEKNYKEARRDIVKFMLMGCLAIYSQYGAGLIIGTLYAGLVIRNIYTQDRKKLLFIIIVGFTAVVLCGLPLLKYFLLPQIRRQGTVDVSHLPVFVDNILYSLWLGIDRLLIFSSSSSNIVRYILYICGIGAIVSLFYKDKRMNMLMLLFAVNYLLYFILVAFSFYGYQEWTGSLGCNNLGRRYIMYLVPIAFITIFYGIFVLYKKLAVTNNRSLLLKICGYGLAACYVFAIIKTPAIRAKGHDQREAYLVWKTMEGYKYPTLVECWDSPAFHFYVMHNSQLDHLHNNKIFYNNNWKPTEELIYEYMNKNDIFLRDTLFVICPTKDLSYPALDIYTKTIAKEGYTIEYLLDRREGDNKTNVLRCTRPGHNNIVR